MKKTLRILFIIGMACLVLDCSPKKGNYYFDFDHVEHYSIAIKENALFDLEEKENLNQKEQLKIDLVLKDKPGNLADTSFIQKLTEIGFTKHEIRKEKFIEFNEIFREKTHDEVYAFPCVRVYRDILIFKKTGSVVGIAKICFDCSDSHIIGTQVNTAEFGHSGDYEKLYRLLEK